jgi:protein-S-isoprenylcysteine O-methyltransferase Ste14
MAPQQTPSWTQLPNTRAFDLLAAAPLAVLYLLALAGLAPMFAGEWRLYAAGQADFSTGLELALNVLTACYGVLTLLVLAVRQLPLAKAAGLPPRLIALIASNLQIGVLALPHIARPAAIAIPALALSLLGVGGEIAVLAWLGPAFSVLPQARRLVTRGPYRFVRHPLYLANAIASIGVSLQHAQPLALLIAAAAFGFQLWRMRFEEAILRDTFPGYDAYADRTARLIPGLY